MEVKKTVEKASSSYLDNSNARALVQLIPYVGGSLDTLMSGSGTEIQKRRFESFLAETNSRLSRLEGEFDSSDNEELFDLFINMLDGVVKTRSKEKREYYSAILCNQLTVKDSWEEAEIATRILKEIDVIHIQVLKYSAGLHVVDNSFNCEKVFSLNDRFQNEVGLNAIPYIGHEFPEYTPAVLRMVCSELVAKSLLHDVGLGGAAIGAMDFCSPTDMANWFIDWVGVSE